MKVFVGRVISTKMNKTATVAVERIMVHPVYKKRYKRIKKYHVHDEMGVAEGQKVKFAAAKPKSKLKKWTVLEIVDTRQTKPKKTKPKTTDSRRKK